MNYADFMQRADMLLTAAIPVKMVCALSQLHENLPCDYWEEYLANFPTQRLDANAWERVERQLRLALAERFQYDTSKLNRIKYDMLADVVYYLPEEDGSPVFFAKALFQFIHEESHAPPDAQAAG